MLLGTWDLMEFPHTHRDCHGYRKTHGFEVMGLVGTGMVVAFSTLRHTAYLYHSITGIHGYLTIECK